MLLLIMLLAAVAAKESFTESLEIIQNKNGKVGFSFHFKTKIPALSLDLFDGEKTAAAQDEKTEFEGGEEGAKHHRLLAKSISDLIERFKVQELHLSFTQGRWAYDRWNGFGFSDGREIPVPPGALLRVWLQDPTQFKGLTNSLAGLFCSSLNFMGTGITSSPVEPFSPFNPLLIGNATLKYSHLPREVVCTENLTPWAKLLPCKTKAGLATLLNGYKLFNGDYQSMAIHWVPINVDGELYYEFTQTVTSVLDPLRTIQTKRWSFSSILGSPISKTCPLASSSTIELSLMDGMDPNTLQLSPTPSKVLTDGRFSFDAKHFQTLDIKADWTDSSVDKRNPFLAPITAHRYLGGSGQEHGSIKVEFVNKLDLPTAIAYTETIPWILKTYIHTLSASAVLSTASKEKPLSKEDVIKKILYSPAIDRERPSVLELSLLLPPHSTTYLSFDFDFAFVKVNEHHPDAAHGFDIGTAVIRLANGANIYTESLLIRLPTPDFSMPYNVITLTCTVLSMYFGSMFNMLTRKYVPILDKSFKK